MMSGVQPPATLSRSLFKYYFTLWQPVPLASWQAGPDEAKILKSLHKIVVFYAEDEIVWLAEKIQLRSFNWKTRSTYIDNGWIIPPSPSGG